MNRILKRISYTFLSVLMMFVAGNITALSKTAIAQTQTIAAVVNDEIITDSDLRKRMHLIMASSGLPNTKDVRGKLIKQVLGNLIDEQIMLQEAEKHHYDISQEEMENGFAKIAQQNNKNPEQFKNVLTKMKADISTMRHQIKAQLAWGKVIQGTLRSRVVISERDINDTAERIRTKIGTTEYHAAEIFLPIKGTSKEKEIKKLANELVREIKSGKASFFKLAQQFSQAAGATNGGDKGWVNEAQFPDELLQGLKKLSQNQITSPIKTTSGYHILLLHEKRSLSEETIPSRAQIEYSIGMERIERLQRQYLMDLRLASYIDIRL